MFLPPTKERYNKMICFIPIANIFRIFAYRRECAENGMSAVQCFGNMFLSCLTILPIFLLFNKYLPTWFPSIGPKFGYLTLYFAPMVAGLAMNLLGSSPKNKER